MAKPAYFKDPEGNLQLVEQESWAAAAKKGWKPASEADIQAHSEQKAYGAPLPTAIATGTRALSGLTGGLSGLAMSDEAKEFQRKAEEASPIATGIGYVAGSLVPGAAVAKGAGLAIKSTGWAATALKGGLTNTAFGVSQLVDDAIMKRRDPITVEHAATQLSHDLLIGAAVDTALKGAGTVASKAWGKLFAKSKQADIGMPQAAETGLEDTIARPGGGPAVGPSTPWQEGQFIGGRSIDPKTLTDEDIAMMAARAGAQGRKAASQAAGGEGTRNIRGEAKKIFEEVKLDAPQGLEKEGWLKKKGDELLIKRIIKTRSDAKYHMAGTREDQLVDFVRRKNVFKDASAWESWDTAGARIDDTAAAIEKDMVAALQEAERKAPAAQFASAIEERITKSVNDLYKGRPEALDIASREVEKVRRFLNDPSVSWEMIRQNRSDLWKRSHGKTGEVLDKLSSDVVSNIQRELRDSYIEAIAANAGKDLGKAVKQANNDLELVDVLGTLFDRKTVPPGAGSGLPGWGDIAAGGIGAAAGGGVAAAVGVAARRAAVGAYRQRPLIERQLLYSKGAEKIGNIAGALRDRLKSVAANQHLGQLKAPIWRMISLTDDELMDEHANMSVGVDGPEYMQALGLQHETSEEELEKLGEKAEEAEKMRIALEARRNKITQAARKFTGKKTELSTEIEVKEPPAEYAYGATPGKYDYKALAKKLRGSDPADMMDTLMSKGWSQAPSEHLESIKQAVDRMQFLKERLPKETPATALRPAAKASEAEWARWKRYYDVVVNPDAFFDQVSSGLVSKEAMEAMETLYPAQLQEFRMSLMAEAERGKTLSGAKRAILWRVVGPAAHNMDGNQVQSLQLMQQANAQGAQQQTRPPDGRQAVDAEKNMTTQGQRMEAR